MVGSLIINSRLLNTSKIKLIQGTQAFCLFLSICKYICVYFPTLKQKKKKKTVKIKCGFSLYMVSSFYIVCVYVYI